MAQGFTAVVPWGSSELAGYPRIQESAAGDIEIGPNLATPADLDGAVPLVQLQEDFLAGKQLKTME